MEKDNDIIIQQRNKYINPPNYNFSYYNVRNNAWDFLIKNNINEYPLSINKIIKQNNWYLVDYQVYCSYKGKDIFELISKFPDAFTVQDKNNNFLICFNSQNNRQRIRFSIAHEIGHIVLGHLYKNEKLEKEANMFAARILMPMILIKELDLTNSEELAKLCDVSLESATYRLKRFKAIKERKKFYTNPKEKQLLLQLKPFLINYNNLRKKKLNNFHIKKTTIS